MPLRMLVVEDGMPLRMLVVEDAVDSVIRLVEPPDSWVLHFL